MSEWVDAARLEAIVMEAIEAQSERARGPLLDAVQAGETVVVAPPTGHMCSVVVGGVHLANVPRVRISREGQEALN